jgi:hypothetical protein
MEPLLLYNRDGSPCPCSYQREASKTVCYDNNNGSMIIGCEGL